MAHQLCSSHGCKRHLPKIQLLQVVLKIEFLFVLLLGFARVVHLEVLACVLTYILPETEIHRGRIRGKLDHGEGET